MSPIKLCPVEPGRAGCIKILPQREESTPRPVRKQALGAAGEPQHGAALLSGRR